MVKLQWTGTPRPIAEDLCSSPGPCSWLQVPAGWHTYLGPCSRIEVLALAWPHVEGLSLAPAL